MKSKQSQIISSNTKIRSFLSPYSKYGTRSLSSCESSSVLHSTPITITGIENPKSYINQNNKSQKDKSIVNNNHASLLRINKIDQYKKDNIKQNNGLISVSSTSKLVKCVINNRFRESAGYARDNNSSCIYNKDKQGRGHQNQRNIQKQKDKENSIYDDKQSCELIRMVRELKDKVIRLQKQNRILRDKQIEDQLKIQKQNQIISNLQQAISLNRSHASLSVGPIKQSRSTNYLNFSKMHKDGTLFLQRSFDHKSPKLKIECVPSSFKVSQGSHQQNQRGRSRSRSRRGTHTISEHIDGEDGQFRQVTKNINQNEGSVNLKALERVLNQLQAKKQKQLSQIDRLLFQACC